MDLFSLGDGLNHNSPTELICRHCWYSLHSGGGRWIWILCQTTTCYPVLSAQLLWRIWQCRCHDERRWNSHVLLPGEICLHWLDLIALIGRFLKCFVQFWLADTQTSRQKEVPIWRWSELWPPSDASSRTAGQSKEKITPSISLDQLVKYWEMWHVFFLRNAVYNYYVMGPQ